MNAAAFIRMWGWPILVGVLATVGLVSALVSEQLWASVLSWVGLGLPLVLTLRYWPLRRLFDQEPHPTTKERRRKGDERKGDGGIKF